MNWQVMPKIRRAFVDAEYGQMHYRIAGEPSDKRPLICLHPGCFGADLPFTTTNLDGTIVWTLSAVPMICSSDQKNRGNVKAVILASLCSITRGACATPIRIDFIQY